MSDEASQSNRNEAMFDVKRELVRTREGLFAALRQGEELMRAVMIYTGDENFTGRAMRAAKMQSDLHHVRGELDKLAGALFGDTLLVGVTAKRGSDGVWDLVIERCPYCQERHTHSGGAGEEPSTGHRAAHCEDQTSVNRFGYELVVVKAARAVQ